MLAAPACARRARLFHAAPPAAAAGQRHLQLLYRRCQTPDDLDKALKLTRLNYLARGELQQHKPFSHKTSQILIHVSAASVKAAGGDVLLQRSVQALCRPALYAASARKWAAVLGTPLAAMLGASISLGAGQAPAGEVLTRSSCPSRLGPAASAQRGRARGGAEGAAVRQRVWPQPRLIQGVPPADDLLLQAGGRAGVALVPARCWCPRHVANPVGQSSICLPCALRPCQDTSERARSVPAVRPARGVLMLRGQTSPACCPRSSSASNLCSPRWRSLLRLLQGALQQMFEVFEFMRSHGRRPGPETCYILVKGCVDHGRPDLAEVGPGPRTAAACSLAPLLWMGAASGLAGARSPSPARRLLSNARTGGVICRQERQLERAASLLLHHVRAAASSEQTCVRPYFTMLCTSACVPPAADDPGV